MKICVAQTRPVKGDIDKNIGKHDQFIDLASSCGAALIIFPELSLTGYEPSLAKKLAADLMDPRFDCFQTISDRKQLIIGAGMPTRNKEGICISMLLFQPNKERQIYSKKYIHPDEEGVFIAGDGANGILGDNPKVALAICYEISVPAHALKAARLEADIYIASVAKSEKGIKDAGSRLASIASQHSMTVLMANSVGPSEGFISAGNTAIWDHSGLVAAQLNESNEGILMIDTKTNVIIEKIL